MREWELGGWAGGQASRHGCAVQRVLWVRTERGAWYVGGSACTTICHGLNLLDAALLEKTDGLLTH